MSWRYRGSSTRIKTVLVAAAFAFICIFATCASAFIIPGISIAPKICVIEPAGGAEYRSGDTIPVKWSYSGISDYSIAILELVNGEGSSVQSLCIPIGSNGAGGCNWIVPTNIAGESCRFRIRALLASGESGTFSINTISFSGMNWCVKDYGSEKVAPDSNYFTANRSNVWVDDAGNLHLKLTYANDRWNCVELWTTKTVGYGTYTLDVATDFCADALDKNVVFGFFTWNSDSTVTDANSELDIEITKWRVETDNTIHYTVQPGNTLTGIPYSERTAAFPAQCTNKSRHAIYWSPSEVKFSSIFGSVGTSWSFNSGNPARAREGSLPVVIPKPGSSTQLHLNLWLSQGNAPSDGEEFEVIVSGFRYEAGQ